jgi:hypothetical protein
VYKKIKCEQWTTNAALCALPSNMSVGNVGTYYCCTCTAKCNDSFDFDKIGCLHCKARNSYEEGQRDAGWAGLRLAALCIGVGAYSGSLPPLENPVRDATDLFENQSGIFAPGVSLEQGIINACESVEKLSGVDMQQLPINVNIHCLGNVILQALPPLSQDVSEGAGSADTAKYQYEIVAYLKLKGLDRIAVKVSEGLGIEKIQHLKHVDEEQIGWPS